MRSSKGVGRDDAGREESTPARDDNCCWTFSYAMKKKMKKKRPKDSKEDKALYFSDTLLLRRKKNKDASPNDLSVMSIFGVVPLRVIVPEDAVDQEKEQRAPEAATIPHCPP